MSLLVFLQYFSWLIDDIYKTDDIVILNINGIDYYCIISGIRLSEAVIVFRNADLTREIWTIYKK